MIHITEDTPPDMLSGAMDLTVHLPTGKSVKMCVERSTPMMDLLVQVTTKYQLQITNYTLQALQMAPSSGCSDKILPYYPNTPIGALDTQHVRVVPKQKTFPVPKNVPPGHQPFESTFRLKVHLPRNQLYVTRVGRNIHLGDIMKKVCDEKNLDSLKYECRHPGNPNEILDPKLTLNDYMITEIYIVAKGSNNLNQFSTNDIMTLRKEEERKQMHTKTGGGVFNLIFRRGKHSSSGSVSTDNSSPPTSDESRSITPPAIQPPAILRKEPEKPKVPQRKRRPAPKPPQLTHSTDTNERRTSNASNKSTSDAGTVNSLTICHSRNSSDSSGYHETSILSDHCNTSLPRRPKSMMQQDEADAKMEKYGGSMSNLTKMTTQSRSTSSLALGRKKKAAPPPPPTVASPQNSTKSETTAVVAASHSPAASSINSDLPLDSQGTPSTNTNPLPTPRRRKAPVPVPRNVIKEEPHENQKQETENEQESASKNSVPEICDNSPKISVSSSIDNNIDEIDATCYKKPLEDSKSESIYSCPYHEYESDSTEISECEKRKINLSTTDILKSLDYLNLDENGDSIKPPEIIAVIPKSSEEGSSNGESSARASINSRASISDDNLTKEGLPLNGSLNEINDKIEFKKEMSVSSLKSSDSTDFAGGRMKRWGSVEKLDELSTEEKWVVGDQSEAESMSSINSLQTAQNHMHSLINEQKDDTLKNRSVSLDIIETYKTDYLYDKNLHDSGNSSDISDKSKSESPSPVRDIVNDNFLTEDTSWSYDIPSPPKAFKDDTPNDFINPPDLIEKLKNIEDQQNVEKMCNKLSLESLEKRKSLVYNRELTTSLKMTDENYKTESETFSVKSSHSSDSLSKTYLNFDKTFDDLQKQEVRKNLVKQSTLPNFKITTYDNPKQKINIFEDDTIRSSSDNLVVRSNTAKRCSEPRPMQKKSFATSMENISLKNHENFDGEFKKPKDPRLFKTRSDFYKKTLNRSESLSRQNWSPTKPVTRSKSQVAINRYKERLNLSDEENLTKSSSLFDVSGLQSLEVIRNIQHKLSTPSASTEDLDKIDDNDEVRENNKKENYSKDSTEKNKQFKNTEKIYKYSGPPSINMATWSERPKRPVSVKEDEDYKLGLGANTNSKIILNDSKSHVEVGTKSSSSIVNIFNSVPRKTDSQNVSIKVNGSESISSEKNGNVLIKIRGNDEYRHPFGNINKNTTQRPHSVAFPSDFDISRVPIVKAVELKKNVKDVYSNTSITQINQNSFNNSMLDNKYNRYSSSDNLSNFTMKPTDPKPVFRTKSFFQPVVKGFRNSDTINNNQNNVNNRHSWQPNTFMTLPLKTKSVEEKSNFSTNQNVPFSKNNLRRTESTKLDLKVEPPKIVNTVKTQKDIPAPPPAPIMPKFDRKKVIQPVVDPRNELLKSIRDFGGKKGLRSKKA